ncbi:unnamed protein product [Caenorhabditis bovis]|uniref:Thioredoxin domain-containing protein n=1 Tax=Caenorhabditis bovis TaxID=2654633 RepID=A0A8S1F2A2_9PELO|nr:unnamed protein product [Caenorhabditis bovis]
MNDGMWFIEFYAPWCAHCKRLHPIWEQLGHAVADINLPVRIGKMDCTRFTTVANHLGITGYPSIIFFRNGKRIDYRGNREKDSLFNFVKRCAAPIVQTIDEKELLKVKMDSRVEPQFVYFGTTKSPLYETFTNAATSKFSMARFFAVTKNDDETESRERIVVYKDNNEIEFKEDKSDLESWITRERWPSFVAATSMNLADIGSSGKLTVLVILKQLEMRNATTEIGKFHKTAVEAVKDLRKQPKLWRRFQFAWLDGSDLASQIQMNPVKEPHMFVFNYSTYEYYLSEDEPSKMTKQSMLTFLEELSDSIDKGTVLAHGGRDLLTRIKRMLFELYWNVSQMFATQPLLSSCLFGVPIAFLSIICYSICSADFTVDRDEFYPDDDEDQLIDEEQSERDDDEETDHEKAD